MTEVPKITIRFRGLPDPHQPVLLVRAFGDTFSAREALKAGGYKWDASERQWIKTVSGAEAIKAEAEWIKANMTDYRVVRG